MINGVVFAVYSELSASPFEFQNSPFIMEIKKIIAERNANKVFSTNWFGKDITLPDAYAIINHVKKSFVNKKTKTVNFFSKIAYIQLRMNLLRILNKT